MFQQSTQSRKYAGTRKPGKKRGNRYRVRAVLLIEARINSVMQELCPAHPSKSVQTPGVATQAQASVTSCLAAQVHRHLRAIEAMHQEQQHGSDRLPRVGSATGTDTDPHGTRHGLNASFMEPD